MAIRHDWYQADSKVVVTVLLKSAVEKNYSVKIGRDSILFTATNYELLLNLFKPINAEKSSHKVSPSKVEITLVKETAEKWDQLEQKAEIAPKPTIKRVPNWDKLAKEITEIDNEEAVGEDALENNFQHIYMNCDEEMRRAMNKSFTESNGTTISNDWSKVGRQQVEMEKIEMKCKHREQDLRNGTTKSGE